MSTQRRQQQSQGDFPGAQIPTLGKDVENLRGFLLRERARSTPAAARRGAHERAGLRVKELAEPQISNGRPRAAAAAAAAAEGLATGAEASASAGLHSNWPPAAVAALEAALSAQYGPGSSPVQLPRRSRSTTTGRSTAASNVADLALAPAQLQDGPLGREEAAQLRTFLQSQGRTQRAQAAGPSKEATRRAGRRNGRSPAAVAAPEEFKATELQTFLLGSDKRKHSRADLRKGSTGAVARGTTKSEQAGSVAESSVSAGLRSRGPLAAPAAIEAAFRREHVVIAHNAARPRSHSRTTKVADLAAQATTASAPEGYPVFEADFARLAGVPEPAYRSFTASLPGDLGFDPLNLWKAQVMGTFCGMPLNMRDAELKHARLAMLAVAHWFAVETYHSTFAKALGLPDLLGPHGLCPSPLNGGFDCHPLFGNFTLVVAVLAAFAELGRKKRSAPGAYDFFDPIGVQEFLQPVIDSVSEVHPAGNKWLAEEEVNNGRVAMLGVLFSAYQEYATGVPVAGV